MLPDPRAPTNPPQSPQNVGKDRSTPGFPRQLLLMVVVVAITVALVLGVVIVLTPSPPPTRPSPHGLLGVTVGNPTLGICGQGNFGRTAGCLSGDYVYTLTVESSTLEFGNVACRVLTSSAAVYSAAGGDPGFDILGANGTITAGWSPLNDSMSMTTSDWTYSADASPSTPLTNLYSILVDMGRVDPMGQGYTFVLIETGANSGASSP